MITYLPNFFSAIRVPLAFLLLSDSAFTRVLAICLAMVSDGLDGYLARKYKLTSHIGATLDPIMDKFFVIFTLSVFWKEQAISALHIIFMLGRDFSVLLFMLYLIWTQKWATYQVRAIWTGKVVTCLQFAILLSLALGVAVPSETYAIFAVLGCAALAELYLYTEKMISLGKSL